MHGVNKAHVDSLHTNIATIARAAAEIPLRITSPNHPKGWSGVATGTEINFELDVVKTDEEEPDPEGTAFDRIERDLGGRVFVFRLLKQPPEDPTLWAGWYEQWVAAGDGKFNLVGLSWTFYWGVLYRPRKAILRAEWDSLQYRSKRAAQPHWHIDPDLLVDSYHLIPAEASATQAEGDLIELPAEDIGLVEITEPTGMQELSMKGMHLAMGGWDHAKTHPGCWRYALPATWNEITKWAERTLTYAKEQFEKEFHANVPI
jgi:hypothetical protein